MLPLRMPYTGRSNPGTIVQAALAVTLSHPTSIGPTATSGDRILTASESLLKTSS